ncbi:winged helix-turn-helix domain-containing protein [Pseudonocardia sp. NPDC049635]|uniref:winged helix-turn-helix domain-containing protein n=1 Tax=Pseudonocardia sp. NPDC049635 TaxID=3155506 RepID=UPI00340BBBAD
MIETTGSNRSSSIGHFTPSAPVLIVGATSDDTGLIRLKSQCMTMGWPVVEEHNTTRLAWTASVRHPAAVLVVPSEGNWTVDAVTTIRRATSAPIVAVGDLGTMAAAPLLRAGADALVPAGLSADDTLAHVMATMRRGAESLKLETRYLVSKTLHVDLWQRTVSINEHPVRLTATEFDLLTELMRNSERALPPSFIVPRVWGCSGKAGLNTLRIFICRLRQKLGDDARQPVLVESVREVGYRFASPVVQVPDHAQPAPARSVGEEHLNQLASLVTALGACNDVDEAAQCMAAKLVEANLADGVGVHHLEGSWLRLLAHTGMSPRWAEAVGPRVSLKGHFASAHAVRTGGPVQLAQVTAHPHRNTFRILRGEEPQPTSALFLPVEVHGEVVGCIGLLRWTAAMHTADSLAFLRAACAVYGTMSDLRTHRCSTPPQLHPHAIKVTA